MTGPAGAWTGTRPISSRPTSLVPPGNTRTGPAVAPPGGHSRQADRPVAARSRRPRGGHGSRPQREREPPFGAASASSLVIGSYRSDRPVLYARELPGQPQPSARGGLGCAPAAACRTHAPQGEEAVQTAFCLALRRSPATSAGCPVRRPAAGIFTGRVLRDASTRAMAVTCGVPVRGSPHGQCRPVELLQIVATAPRRRHADAWVSAPQPEPTVALGCARRRCPRARSGRLFSRSISSVRCGVCDR